MKLRSKSIMSLLYVALLSIPLVSILSRVIYVQSNKNAYQSYSDTNLVLEKSELDNVNAITENTTYYLDVDFQSDGVNTLSYRYYYSNINVDWTDYGAVERTYYSFKLLRLASNNNQSYYLWLYYGDTDFQQINILNANMPQLVFTLTNIDTTNSASGFGGNIYTYIYQQQKLDNVFEYSVSKLVSDNNFGQLNFFEWFSGFLLNNEQQNNLYVHFANWYLCYAMLISLMQILFLCLMWFVNFSRKMLDRGMNYDW